MFVSLFFVAFLILLWMVYLLEPVKYRKSTLWLFSYVFCGYISLQALVALVLSTVLVFLGAKAIEDCRNRDSAGNLKAKLIAIAVGFGFAFVLIGVKNIPYLIKMLGIQWVPQDSPFRSLVLPVGFSFYAFGAIGYIYDVYQGKEQAERDFLSFALYMGFFAKLVSGPIERKGTFAKQIHAMEHVKVWDTKRLALAANDLLWGYFLKLVVADRLALIVNEIYRTPMYYDTVWLVGGAIFYSFQVYADFAGYTCIALGCAKLFGIQLSQNFASPYKAVNITDFWRRWHISLSSWLRDYVYIPLGGNRRGTLRKYGNTMIVFILCGIWHGNGLSFLVWGILHGMYSILYHLWAGRRKNAGRAASGNRTKTGTFFARLLTFLAVTFAWIFFRAESLTLALDYIRKMVTNGIHPVNSIPGFESSGVLMIQVYISMALILLVQFMDGICDRKQMVFSELMQKQKRMVRYLFYYVTIILIFVIGIYGGTFPAETFIYMQF